MDISYVSFSGVINYEIAAINAVFPQADVLLCWFHVLQVKNTRYMLFFVIYIH
jgi:hypothetical protein